MASAEHFKQPQMSSIEKNAVILGWGWDAGQRSPWPLEKGGCPNVAEQEGFNGVQLPAVYKSGER